MRTIWRAVTLGAFFLLLTSTAAAEEEFDVTVSGRQVTVTPKGAWHINLAYPWKLVVKLPSDQSVTEPKSSFKLEDKRATVSTKAAGAAVLKGAVCIQTPEQNECRQFQKAFDLP